MRQQFRALGAVAFLVLAAAPQQETRSVDIAGEWDLTIVGEVYTFDMIASFVQEGTELSGTLDGPNGTRELTGSVDGNTVAFSITIPSPEGDFRLDFTGKLEDEELSGTMSSPNTEVDSRWTGRRRS